MISLLTGLNFLNQLALLTAYYDVINILMSHDLSQLIIIVALDEIHKKYPQTLHILKAHTRLRVISAEVFDSLVSNLGPPFFPTCYLLFPTLFILSFDSISAEILNSNYFYLLGPKNPIKNKIWRVDQPCLQLETGGHRLETRSHRLETGGHRLGTKEMEFLAEMTRSQNFTENYFFNFQPPPSPITFPLNDLYRLLPQDQKSLMVNSDFKVITWLNKILS